MALPGTPFAGHFQYLLGGSLGGDRYLAPEIQWPEDYGTDEVLVTKESDVYGMAMVIYEVIFIFHKPTSLGQDRISC